MNIIKEYEPDNTIWNEDNELVDKIKRAVQKLDDAEKIIFILYSEHSSLREVGKILGVSHSTVYKEINKIKKKILDDIGFVND